MTPEIETCASTSDLCQKKKPNNQRLEALIQL